MIIHTICSNIYIYIYFGNIRLGFRCNIKSGLFLGSLLLLLFTPLAKDQKEFLVGAGNSTRPPHPVLLSFLVNPPAIFYLLLAYFPRLSLLETSADPDPESHPCERAKEREQFFNFLDLFVCNSALCACLCVSK
jgi:hypothetical protein